VRGATSSQANGLDSGPCPGRYKPRTAKLLALRFLRLQVTKPSNQSHGGSILPSLFLL